MWIPIRTTHILGFLAAITALLTAYYLQFVQHMAPCSLCIIDRVVVFAMAILFALAALHNPARIGQFIYTGLGMLVASVGILVAGRHVWLQHLPADQVPSCGPGLEFMLKNFPLTETVRMLFHASGECAKVDWWFLGLSLAEMTLIIFIGFAGWSLYQFLVLFKNKTF